MYVYFDEQTQSFINTGTGVSTLPQYVGTKKWTPQQVESVIFQGTDIFVDREPSVALKELLAK